MVLRPLEGHHQHPLHHPGILIESIQHSRAMSVNSETSSPQPASQGSTTVKLSDVIYAGMDPKIIMYAPIHLYRCSAPSVGQI